MWVTCNIPIFSSCTNYNRVHIIHTWSAISWSTSRIRPSQPCPRTRLSSPSYCVFLVCLGPPSSLLIVSTICILHVRPPLTTRWLNTAIQLNNTDVLHLMYNGHVYTSHNFYYSTSSFTLLLYSCAGQLAPTTHVGNIYFYEYALFCLSYWNLWTSLEQIYSF